MFNERSYIDKLIQSGLENDYLDFKKTAYNLNQHDELIKDIVAMANSKFQGDKYIILGVKDSPTGKREIIGLNDDEIRDSAEYHQLIYQNVEPDIEFDFFPFPYEGKILGVIKIHDSADKPFMLKKQRGKLHEGSCFIRKGSATFRATRSDFDHFFNHRESFDINILHPYLHGVLVEEGCAYTEIAIRNDTNSPVTIIYGGLTVRNINNNELYHRVFGFDSYVGADMKISLEPKSEKVGMLYLSFGSSDCLRLGLDQYGTTEESFKFELMLEDSRGFSYSTKKEHCSVFAKGDFLWKVQLAAKEGKKPHFINDRYVYM